MRFTRNWLNGSRSPHPLTSHVSDRIRHRLVVEVQCYLCVLHHFAPSRIDRGVRSVFIVPIPPLVRWSLGVALRRVLPLLLAPERSYIKIAPGAAHRFVTAVIDEVGAKHT